MRKKNKINLLRKQEIVLLDISVQEIIFTRSFFCYLIETPDI